MKIAFAGTPEIAATILQSIIDKNPIIGFLFSIDELKKIKVKYTP